MSIATLQEPIAAIGDDELYEVVDGLRVKTPPMRVFSVWITSDIHGYLAACAKAYDAGRAIAEALFHLPAPVNRDRRPDVAFVSYQR
ncbi:MAG: hypothetical protein FJ303_10795 [Planctomycetes bacterium]|nr:hypothetical protein [Planctomycetota bacterium]